jgi:hypothetical protein
MLRRCQGVSAGGRNAGIRAVHLEFHAQTSGVKFKKGEPMLPPTTMRDWARNLLASEAVPTSGQTEPATVLIYEKLRRQLCAPVGLDGFRALASRALALAKSEAPMLSAVQVTAEGRLRGLGEPESRTDLAQDGEVGIVFIANLLGLFLTFLGAATTRRLVRDVFPLLEAPTEPDTTTPFEIIRQEVGQLRSVSERLASLADRHPAVEDGLVSISENIRNIATILDVFVVIKDRPDGNLTVQTSKYLM